MAYHESLDPQIQRRKRIRMKKRRRRKIKFYICFIFLSILCIALLKPMISPSPRHDSNGGDPSTISKNRESSIPDNKWIPELEKLSTDKEKIKRIIEQIDQYPDNILTLLLSNTETIDFALHYPELGKIQRNPGDIDLPDGYETGSIPLFMQWDTRWGYNQYGENGIIALDGCGPTCLSMVMVGLTGDRTWNPAKMALFSQDKGFLDESSGTSWDLMTAGAQQLGLVSKELPLDEGVIRGLLQKGKPIICSVRPGDFTTIGHFIVLREYEDGKIFLNDPNSVERSQQAWTYSTLEPQIKNLWVFDYF